MAATPGDSEKDAYLAAHNITVRSGPCDEQMVKGKTKQLRQVQRHMQTDGMSNDLNQRRHHWTAQWLAEGDFQRVFSLDVRDVVFQKNPFSIAEAENLGSANGGPELIFFTDNEKGQAGGNWLTWRACSMQTFGKLESHEQAEMAQKPNLCGGTILATHHGMERYLSSMNALVEDLKSTDLMSGHMADELRKELETGMTENFKMVAKSVGFFKLWDSQCHNRDQPMMNYLVHKGGEKALGVKFAIFGTNVGDVYNMEADCEKNKVRKDKMGKVLNSKGNVPAVLHKYDHCKDTFAKTLTYKWFMKGT